MKFGETCKRCLGFVWKISLEGLLANFLMDGTTLKVLLGFFSRGQTHEKNFVLNACLCPQVQYGSMVSGIGAQGVS